MEALLWKNRQIGTLSAGATFIGFAAGSYISTSVRCYMLLIVPGLFAGRGRALLMTISVGLLLDGPVANLNTNVQKVSKFFVCLYEHMKVLACNYQASYSAIVNDVTYMFDRVQNQTQKDREETAGFLTSLKEKMVSMKSKMLKAKDDLYCNNKFVSWLAGGKHKRGCAALDKGHGLVPEEDDTYESWKKKLTAEMDPVLLKENKTVELLQTQSTASIKEKLIDSTQYFFDTLQYVLYVIKVVFYVFSLAFMMYQAYDYLIMYLCDDGFDNRFVNNTLDKENSEKLLPLRNWELKEKFQMTNTKKLSNNEYISIGLLLITPLLFSLATIGIIMADNSFASYIDILKENGKFGISFLGMDQGYQLNGLLDVVENGEVPLMKLQLEAFDLSTDPCLPKPVKTEMGLLVPIIVLLSISVITCFLDAYLQRIRQQICNMFYPER